MKEETEIPTLEESYEFDYKFTTEEFDKLLLVQKKKCYLTGRPLTMANINLSHIIPFSKGGTHDFNNLCFVVEEAKRIKRHYTDEEIVELAVDIIKHLGPKYGYTIKKASK
ncbi:hypothetical protein EHO61_08855 [Leptospira fluminis]|uniref:HNH endonuclease n=1 Tax=Leptospira fluminis TaxID=2484979 RepID=A0A4R9GPU4_9LEPT|nr:hypothetical protein [Leptospira fluminis]TGK19000.1 hypothetical protein EHO61_08855 [Leptospira fluminis]